MKRDDYQFPMELLYIHIPKNAGTSVLKAFELLDNPPSMLYRMHTRFRGHKTLKVYYKNGFNQDAPVVGIIRNPWDRLVSLYLWKKDQSSFKNFIKYGITREIPQVDWFKYNGSISDNVHILKFENIEKEWPQLLIKLNLPFIELPLTNKQHHLHYSTFYDTPCRRIIEKLEKETIELFDYKFETES